MTNESIHSRGFSRNRSENADPAVKSHHFDLVHNAIIADDTVRDFIAGANPAALREIAQRLIEAEQRGLWQPRSNSARATLDALAGEQT